MILEILIVEDDDIKADRLLTLVNDALGRPTVQRESSFSSGIRAVHGGSWDLVILDMTLPSYDPSIQRGNRMRPYAGKEFLYQMEMRGIDVPVVIVTQFDEFGEGESRKTLTQLRDELAYEFASRHVDVVYYSPAESSWRQRLSELLLNTKKAPNEHPNS